MEHNNESPSVALSLSRKLALALGLGWSVAEFVGRYRHGIHPRNPAARKSWRGKSIPRLSYSSCALRSNNDLFWLLAQRLIVLSDEFGLDDLEDKDKADSVDARIRALPAEIRKYIADPSSTTCLEPQEFYQLLEDWTQLIRLELGVQAQALREAFSFGGELADLYWALPVPQRPNLPTWAGAWRKVSYKVPGVLETLDRVKVSLPPYAFAAVEHSLKQWRCVHPAWLEGEFSLEQARLLSGRFGEQATVWGDILQGEHLPTDYLAPKDRLYIRVLSTTTFAIAVSLVVLVFLTIVVGAFPTIVWTIIAIVRHLFPNVPATSKPTELPLLSDWLALGGVSSASVWFFSQLGDIYGWLRSQLMPFFVRRRTLVAWERE